MYCVPWCKKHENFPWRVLVTVELIVDVSVDVAVLDVGREVTVDVADEDAVVVADDVAVVVVVMVEVIVLDADVVSVV